VILVTRGIKGSVPMQQLLPHTLALILNGIAAAGTASSL